MGSTIWETPKGAFRNSANHGSDRVRRILIRHVSTQSKIKCGKIHLHTLTNRYGCKANKHCILSPFCSR